MFSVGGWGTEVSGGNFFIGGRRIKYIIDIEF